MNHIDTFLGINGGQQQYAGFGKPLTIKSLVVYFILQYSYKSITMRRKIGIYDGMTLVTCLI